jgi:spore maturation protein CgeB
VKICIEGPRWSGMWTEIIADTLQDLGHRVAFRYHNRKRLSDRMALAGTVLRGTERSAAWARRHRRQLLQAMQPGQWDLLLSIQGKLDAASVRQLRAQSPGLRVVFWWGDVLTDKGRAAIREAAVFSDRILVSYRGSYEQLRPLYGDRLVYFPFGVSPAWHSVPELTARDRRRFTADVAFVGTCYPERCELIRYLNTRLASPVRVWGRGWRHCRGSRGHGALSLQDSLKVHACARISLNLHHRDTDNGCNMKFYEIPAAHGFQVCDWQPLLATTALGQSSVACRSLPEFAAAIDYYLAHEQERKRLAAAASRTVFATAGYAQQLAQLLDSLD